MFRVLRSPLPSLETYVRFGPSQITNQLNLRKNLRNGKSPSFGLFAGCFTRSASLKPSTPGAAGKQRVDISRKKRVHKRGLTLNSVLLAQEKGTGTERQRLLRVLALQSIGASPLFLLPHTKTMPTTSPSPPTDVVAIRDAAIARLVANPIGGYNADSPKSSEPIAWASIALSDAGKSEAARQGAEWLADIQAKDGSVGVTADDPTPAWPTSLALLAWAKVDRKKYADRIKRAAEWALAQKPWLGVESDDSADDPSIPGWSWAADTYSWLEPTAFFVLGLREAGYDNEPHARDGVRMLVDRLLPSGGANYGNTVVLGQELLPHVQPTGILTMALAGETIESERYGRTLDYLATAALEPTGTASLCYAILGLAANGRPVDHFTTWLGEAWQRAEKGGGVYKRALVTMAAHALVTHTRGGDPS